MNKAKKRKTKKGDFHFVNVVGTWGKISLRKELYPPESLQRKEKKDRALKNSGAASIINFSLSSLLTLHLTFCNSSSNIKRLFTTEKRKSDWFLSRFSRFSPTEEAAKFLSKIHVTKQQHSRQKKEEISFNMCWKESGRFVLRDSSTSLVLLLLLPSFSLLQSLRDCTSKLRKTRRQQHKGRKERKKEGRRLFLQIPSFLSYPEKKRKQLFLLPLFLGVTTICLTMTTTKKKIPFFRLSMKRKKRDVSSSVYERIRHKRLWHVVVWIERVAREMLMLCFFSLSLFLACLDDDPCVAKKGTEWEQEETYALCKHAELILCMFDCTNAEEEGKKRDKTGCKAIITLAFIQSFFTVSDCSAFFLLPSFFSGLEMHESSRKN